MAPPVSPQPIGMRIRGGEFLRINLMSNTALVVDGRARVIYDDGTEAIIATTDFTTNGTRVLESTDSSPVSQNGWVVNAYSGVLSGGKRGQCFAQLVITDQAGKFKGILCRGYIYAHRNISQGEFTEPGPGGGEGFLSWVQVFHDRAGDAAALDFDLFATNALRKVLGCAWYYHCDGTVASRVHNSPVLHGLGGTKPTGFTLTGNNAIFMALGGGTNTLTADEEGAHIAYSTDGNPGRFLSVDNGAATIASAATNPSTFPLWVTEADTDTILRFPAITNGVATDTHSAYVLMEEWLVL